jgi:uncharacterized protein
MRALLDVTVLIALLDADHVSHRFALQWFTAHAAEGWASCPITQNGCLRIISHPSYPNTRAVHDVAERLREVTSNRVHEFWPDSVSLLDTALFDSRRVHSTRQLTDAYLLALAVSRRGRLVTLDRSIALSAVSGATAANVVVL